MKPVSDDRRIRRTRHLLGAALVELMLEKPYEAITIQDILDRADVGRSTFYSHYTDKDNLLMSEISRVIHALDVNVESAGAHRSLLPSLELFRHVKQQRRLTQAFLWGRGADMLTRGFQEQISSHIQVSIRSIKDSEAGLDVPLPLIANFAASTFVVLIRWWFEHDLRQPPEEIDALYQKLVMPSLHTLLRESG